MIATLLPPEIAAKLKREGDAARALRKDGYPTSGTPYLLHIKRIDAIAQQAKEQHPHLYRNGDDQ